MKSRPLLKLSPFQLKELSKYWFDLSKLSFGSLIIKLFEPGARELTPNSLGVVIFGLSFAIAFGIIGLVFSKEVDK